MLPLPFFPLYRSANALRTSGGRLNLDRSSDRLGSEMVDPGDWSAGDGDVVETLLAWLLGEDGAWLRGEESTEDFPENSDGDFVSSLDGFVCCGMVALKGVTTEWGTPSSLVLKFKSIISVFLPGGTLSPS